MIPIIPRQSSDDDRPMGLKFTRNNFYNFPKREATNNEHVLKRTPSGQRTPPLITKRDSSRDSDLSSVASLSPTPLLSPTLPARSPFRIRDSQQGKMIGSHDTKSKSSSTIDTSSSSSSTSSSVTTNDDDLIQELESMWKLKSVPTKPPTPKHDMSSEDMLLQLLISHAMIDSREFKVLTFEEFEKLKQHHARLKNRVRNSKAKLELDRKIQETSHSLSNLSFNKNRESVILLLDEAVEADRKVKILTQRLHELTNDEVETQYQILQHTAGVLSLGLQKLEKDRPVPVVDGTQQMESLRENLIQLLKKHNISHATDASPTSLLDYLEAQLETYQLQSRESEDKYRGAQEKQQLLSLSEKKLEIQLRSTQTKNDLLKKEMDELLLKVKKPVMDWLPQDDFDFQDDDHGNESALAEVAELRETLSQMELNASKVQSQLSVFQSRENGLKKEMEQYRDEAVRLRSQKEEWDRTMKRRTVLQALENAEDGSSTARFEQQLEEQEGEYQAQLKEQAAFLDKTTRACEQLQKDRDELSATCEDLELLIRDKTRALDARDRQIQQLESELHQLKSTPTPAGSSNAALQELQAQFSQKESAWIEQSNTMEADFEGILKEFDRLTGTAMEFETDKRNYERRIQQLTQEVNGLESSLTEEKTKNLGYHEADTPTTATLRKEFRRMITDMKSDHHRTLEREGQEKSKLEKQLKDLKHEREMFRYERTNKGVQTLFMP
ncbi:hypothetical protein INT47_001904 [Mucor saturninus]|uniref:Up-regulated during septation protein 1 domain-containing protein n=1 Tax=Mucor saturninus TaxID=64648 RepID=A0A8H7REL9_9FUNG|nr:hypothetical protein INT47_001904 [Mucor saturninus]